MKKLLDQGWVRAIFMLIMSQIMTGFIIVPFYLMGYITAGNFSIESVGINLSTLIILLNLIGNIFLIYQFRKLYDKETFLSLGLLLKNSKLDLGYGLIWGAGLITLAASIIFITKSSTMEFNGFSPLLLLSYFLFFILVSLNEELLIRGYILNNLIQSFNKYIALGVSSILFMLLHASNDNVSILAMVNLFLAGLLLGVYYIHQQNIWFSVGMHFTWNYFQGPIFGFEVSGQKVSSLVTQNLNASPIITGGEFGLEGSLLLTFILMISIVIVHFKYCKKPILITTKNTINQQRL